MLSDLRYALRTLGRAPGFALVAVLSLALGVGANATIFSVANALLLRPVAGAARGDRLVRVYRGDHGPLTYRELAAVRARAAGARGRPFAGVVGERLVAVGRTDGPAPEQTTAAVVSGGYFATLGVRPALGRLFSAEDELAAPQQVAVVSHRYWAERLGGDPAAVGRTLRVNGRPFTVVGVAPPGFTSSVFLWRPDLFVPASASPALLGVDPRTWGGSLYVTARLVPGASPVAAEAALLPVMRELRAADPGAYDERGARFTVGTARGIHAEVRAPAEAVSAGLLAVVGVVLLIACANVANLLLARTVARRREVALRVALGAGRPRLVRQLFAESVLLAAGGAALGLGLAAWAARALAAALVASAPEGGAGAFVDFAPDGRVLAYTAALAAATALLFGLAPAVRAARPDLVPSLKDGGAQGGVARSRARSALVVAQVALCTVLTAGASLFLHSLANARVIDPGFPAAGLVDVPVNLAPRRLGEEAERAFYARLVERARALPGVRAAALAHLVPLGGSNMMTGTWVEGRPSPERPDGSRPTYFNVVGDGYFETLGIPVVRGRDFTAADRAGAPGAVVVNETMARRLWPGQNPLGRRLGTQGAGGPWMEVVGVARDTKYNALGEAPPAFMYLPHAQHFRGEMVLQVRAAPGASTAALARALARLVPELDPLLPPPRVTSAEQDMAISLLPARAGAVLLATFGGLALLLAGVGVYGVAAYAVAQRTRELGVRAALGAPGRDLARLMLLGTGRLVGAGLAGGLVLAAVVGRLVASQLYSVGAVDPVTFAATPVVLAGAGLLAGWLPARRAARVSPMQVLRVD